MRSHASVEAEYAPVIEKAVEQFGDHEGMSAGRVLKWLMQFADEDLALAQKILERVRYINATNIRGMAKSLAETVRDQIVRVGEERIVFVPIAVQPGGGADLVVRALRSMRNPFQPRVATMVDLAELDPDSLDALVFVDDFAGTGDTLLEWWESVEMLVRPVSDQVVIGALVMTTAAAAVAQTIATATSVIEIGEEGNVFADGGGFEAAERGLLLRYCEATGSDPIYLRGYGDCGLLLAFRHGCPDNSLPILWYNEGWDPLFLRRAI